MLISEFVRRTGLGRETVRHYVRLGLLQPQQTQIGGRHPYLMFTDDDVASVEAIRVGRALGLSLREISDMREERRKGHLPLEQRIRLMREQLARLDEKSAQLETLKSYVRAKITWQEAGESGEGPRLGNLADGRRVAQL
jgi:MerR family copper efflux transcriptional regulator